MKLRRHAGVTPLEMVTAYSTLAAGGQRPTPFFIREVQDASGRVLERTDVKPVPAVSPETAYLTIRLMQEEGADQAGGVMHCFTEDWATAKAALDLGFMISFSGIVTFKSAADLREVAAKVPQDRLLIETDSPYLAPVPHRGKTNEPAWVRHVAQCLADVRSVSLEEIARITTENFFRLFPGAAAGREA